MNTYIVWKVVRRVLPFLVLCMVGACGETGNSRLPRAELKNLNHAMASAPDYRSAKIHRIDSLKRLARRAPDQRAKILRLLEVGDEYRTFIADSALYYYMRAGNEARESGDLELVHSSDIAMVGGMSVAGLFTEATMRLDTLRQASLTETQKLHLWLSARQLYSAMMAFVGNESPLIKTYREQYLAIDDSLLQHLPPTSIEHRFIYAERLVGSGQYAEAQRLLQEIVNSQPVSANVYGKAAYQLALVYRNQGDEHMYASCLARAATSDIAGCVTEGWALPMLADWLYRNGELNQAFNYINYSLSEAMSGNARMRTAVISGMVPTIDDAYRKSLTSSRDQLVVYLVVAVALFLVAAALTVFLLRQIKRSRVAQRKLAENNRLREVYLANFVGLCSNYSARLRSWQKMVKRKINSGQTDDLMKALKTEKITDENDDFHSAMDQAIIEIYPNFVDEINALLRPDEQIHLTKPDTMTPELRIYALIRLGVNESTRIASILQYSTNTIYTYRNKMRNKALDHDNFEEQVRRIGTWQQV